MHRIIFQSLLLIFLWLVYYFDIDAIVCYACMFMDVVWCSTTTSSRWDIRGDPEEEGRWRLKLTEGSVCKIGIAWDHPCYLFTFNHLIHIACVYLVANKDILDIWYLVPWYIWGIALDSMMLVLNYNLDIVTWLMVYAINTKRCFLATWNQGARSLGCFYGALDSSP